MFDEIDPAILILLTANLAMILPYRFHSCSTYVERQIPWNILISYVIINILMRSFSIFFIIHIFLKYREKKLFEK